MESFEIFLWDCFCGFMCKKFARFTYVSVLELSREKSCWVEIPCIFLSHGANYKCVDLLRWSILAYMVVLKFKRGRKVRKCTRGLFKFWQKITPFPRVQN